VDAHPYRKARLGPWYYTYAALGTFTNRYLVNPPRVQVRAAGRTVEAVTVVVQNSDPFTYFASRPIRVCEGAGIETGSLSLAALKRATPFQFPTLLPRVLSGRPCAVARHRQVESLPRLEEAVVETADGRGFPLEVDGDYLGEFERVEFTVAPAHLAVVS
jgi:diacylglycerol kinase family enzyme